MSDETENPPFAAAHGSPVYYVPLFERIQQQLGTRRPPPKKKRAKATKSRIKPCPIGTFVSYASIDGTCHKVENYRHAWCADGTCANCDMTRAEAGYPANAQRTDARDSASKTH